LPTPDSQLAIGSGQIPTFRSEAFVDTLDQNDRLIALVGLRAPIPENGKRVLLRCQLRSLQFPRPEDAWRSLPTTAFDAVVLDSHHPKLRRLSAPLQRLLDLILARRRGEHRIPLVVLRSPGFPMELRQAYENAGAVYIPARQQTYREIAKVVRRLIGLPGGCCEPRASLLS
jgi:hypothetical protein